MSRPRVLVVFLYMLLAFVVYRPAMAEMVFNQRDATRTMAALSASGEKPPSRAASVSVANSYSNIKKFAIIWFLLLLVGILIWLLWSRYKRMTLVEMPRAEEEETAILNEPVAHNIGPPQKVQHIDTRQ